jgi:hypothetical protein
MFVMELLARLRDRALCASITCVAALCPGPNGGGVLIALGAAGDLGTALRFRFAGDRRLWWCLRHSTEAAATVMVGRLLARGPGG